MDNYKEITLQSYEARAAEHAARFKMLFDLERRAEFKRFIELLPQRDENGFDRRYILDLGCGAGDHAAYFTEQGLGVIGIDLSPSMVELAKAKGLDVCVMDIEDLKFQPDLFHGIWSVTSLLHIPKTKMLPVINKLHEILKKDGLLYVCVKDGEGERFIPDENDPSTQRFFSFWKETELCDIFANHFSVIESQTLQKGHTRFVQAFYRRKNYHSTV